MIHQNAYVLYGIRIDDSADWLKLEEDPGQWRAAGDVGYFSAGRYDDNFYFLAVKVEEIEPGRYHLVTGDSMFLQRKEQTAWDDALRATAERLGLDELDDPGWYFVPHEA